MVESGLVKHYLTDELPLTSICPKKLQSSGRKLSMSDLGTTFELWITGICASLGFLILEVCLKSNLFIFLLTTMRYFQFDINLFAHFVSNKHSS
jgi:hypothetical protein